eukprot:CAMPEP_0171948146 /NCGR_PEP_ID=MMETSP0993-20121228/64589_1 /TAXON_ID=483369 /ORGANISM="non described non described, Strain CCMP2098" /LENGTH=68 /DNA_ID=CAMNT_0012592143 /DNA_START=181 /DNA_END=383 /DNA_ORIENTATION=-
MPGILDQGIRGLRHAHSHLHGPAWLEPAVCLHYGGFPGFPIVCRGSRAVHLVLAAPADGTAWACTGPS